jgi:hypothetical protein
MTRCHAAVLRIGPVDVGSAVETDDERRVTLGNER